MRIEINVMTLVGSATHKKKWLSRYCFSSAKTTWITYTSLTLLLSHFQPKSQMQCISQKLKSAEPSLHQKQMEP